MALNVFVAHSWKLLTDHRPNGDGLMAYGLLDRLARRGHRVHVGCRAVALREPPPPTLTLHSLDRFDGDLRWRARARYMRRVRRLHDRLAAREPFDVLLVPNPVDAGVSLALPARRAPLVLGPYWADWPAQIAGGRASVASLRAQRGLRRAVRALEQRRAAALLISTEAAREKIHVSGVPVAHVPPGIDPSEFPPRNGRPERPPTAIFLANLRAHKGIFTLLDAFEQVARDVPDACLLVAGGGPEEAAVRERAARSERIVLLGPVDRARVPETLARADVSCQPAHGEPFGWSAVEAMAGGLPVLVTDAGGLAAVVPDAAGLKVPAGDAGALARALTTLLRDPERGRAMGAAGREAVERDYAWDRVIDRLERVLTEAATGASRGGAAMTVLPSRSEETPR